MRSNLPAVVDASLVTGSPVAGTPAGTVVVRAVGLRVQGVTVTAGGPLGGSGPTWFELGAGKWPSPEFSGAHEDQQGCCA